MSVELGLISAGASGKPVAMQLAYWAPAQSIKSYNGH